MRWNTTSTYGRPLHEARVVHDAGPVAIAVSRDGDGYRMSILYRPGGGYTSSYVAASYSSKHEERIQKLLPVYVACVDAIAAGVAAGLVLDDASTNYAIDIEDGDKRVCQVPENLATPMTARLALGRVTRRCEAFCARRTDENESGSAAAYARLVEQLTVSAAEQQRKTLLSSIIADQPELTVDQTMAEVERRCPLPIA